MHILGNCQEQQQVQQGEQGAAGGGGALADQAEFMTCILRLARL